MVQKIRRERYWTPSIYKRARALGMQEKQKTIFVRETNPEIRGKTNQSIRLSLKWER